ncbi:MAG: valine--tRNA ligase [Armatimonadota bacterium]|nr:valine--tRNA ligase [Armatimonadota bacterium]
MTDSTLSTRYDPKQVEEKWYAIWEQNGLFQPRPGTKGAYTITIPPPNVTGSLHMGHALCYAVQDVLGRYKRMQGYEVLLLPGMDHAGIATHKVVEAQLKEEGLTRYDLGREKFVERVWQWKEESGGTILRQFKRLGFAFDWSRERFTMDPAYHDAVLRVFIEWFERGLIYRGKRVINWDPGLRTSVSDIEMNDEVRRGKLYHINYPFEDGSGHVTIATTRPETMLADVAVAVNPKDKRYEGLVGKKLILPILRVEIPLIADEYPDPEFGTGAVKITPAHDPNDFEVGKRMGLDFNDIKQVPVCIGEDARVIAEGTPFHGLDRFEARKRIVEELEKEGCLEKIEDYDIPLKISDRSGQVIEPLLSEQWFCSMKPLAAPAIDAVRSGKIKFTPERYADVYLRWMEEIRDWCLSRQLWWGHRIPIYYDEQGNPFAAMSEKEAREKAGGPASQDPDVLDTWFSSALWPFATMGWPEQTEDLEKFYPTNALVTARDIIYLWVARMIMDGLDQMKEIPFCDVYIYATVLTESGQRMSKSLGTGVDPIEFIDQFGADAMRFALLVQTGHNQEIRFGEKRIEEARNFCNKIWNASRFALMNIGEDYAPVDLPGKGALEDRWILSRLAKTTKEVGESIDDYNMMQACKALQEFFWGDFCDWYIELAKDRLSGDEKELPQTVAVTVLENFCKLAHPFMPHITEEIAQMLPAALTSTSANASEADLEVSATGGTTTGAANDFVFLDYEPWPVIPEAWIDEHAEAMMNSQMEIVRVVRSLRQDSGINPKQTLPVLYMEGPPVFSDIVRSQAKFERIEEGKPEGASVSVRAEGIEFHLPLEGLLNKEKELERLTKAIDKLEKELAGSMARLNNPQFTQRAKPEIVEREREAAKAHSDEIASLQQKRNQVEAL